MTTEYREETREFIKRIPVRTLCDWCNKEIEGPYPYDTRDFELSFTAGASYPTGGNKEGWEVEDLCDSCVEKLKVLLIKEDIKITVIKRDW